MNSTTPSVKKRITVTPKSALRNAVLQSRGTVQHAALTAQEQQKDVKKVVPGRPFKPGQSGNPNGRPAGRKSFTTLVREALQKTDEKTGLTLEQHVIDNVVQLSRKGNIKILELLWNYIDGKPNQPMDLTISGEELSEDERGYLDELLKKNT